MNKKYDKSRPCVVLDSNIIQYFNSPELAKGILESLKEAVDAEYNLVISDYTFFELLNGSSVAKEQEIVSTLSGITRIYVKKSVLIAAAHLGCLYKEDGMDSNAIDSGDLIIGATSILTGTGSMVLTANIRDFPAPFFKEIQRKQLTYTKNGVTRCLFIAFLAPDHLAISSKHTERTQPALATKKSQK